MADTLRINIDVNAAKAALTGLRASFVETQTSTENFASKASASITKFNTAVQGIQKIDSATISSVGTFATALNKIEDTGNLRRTATALGALNKLDPSAVTTKIKDLSAALDHLKVPTLDANGLKGVASALGSLSRADAEKVTRNIQALVAALSNLKIPPGLDAAAAVLGNLASAAKTASGAIGGIKAAVDPAASAAKSLAAEFQNAIGFQAGLGVSVGNLVKSYQSLAANTGTAQGALKKFIETVGTGPAIFTALGASFIVFNTLANAITPAVSAVVNVTDKVTAFKTSLDAVGGKGAGSKAFGDLQRIAKQTGQDISQLTGVFQQFSVATQQSGVTAKDSLKVFEDFSVAFKGSGASAEQTTRGFTALAQSFSKGNVQAEELRGQLSEALPGAFGAAARAMGVTESELNRLLKTGQVTAKDLLPKLGEELRRTFEAGVAKQVETATSNINEFNTAIFNLQTALGNGGLGGLAGGFAAGLDKINVALQSDAVQVFARAIGDLAGLLLNVAGSAIGGFVKGLTSLADGISRIAQFIGNSLGITKEFFEEFLKGNEVMKIISGVVYVVAAGLGALSAAFVLNKTVALASTAATVAYQAALAIFPGLFGGASAAIASNRIALAGMTGTLATTTAGLGFFRTAMTATWAALRANPIGLLVSAVAILGPLLWDIVAPMLGFGDATEKTKTKIDALSPSVKVVSEALKEFSESVKESPVNVANMVAELDSLDAKSKEAKAAIAAFKDENFDATQAISSLQKGLREAVRDHTSHTDALRKSKIELQLQKGELSDQGAKIREAGKAAKDSAVGYSELGKSAGGVKSSVSGVSESLDRINKASREVSGAMRETSAEAGRSNIEFNKVRSGFSSAADALDSYIDSNKAAIKEIKDFGFILSESGKAFAEELVAIGKTKEEAGKLAATYDILTQSQADLLKKQEEQIAMSDAAIAVLSKRREEEVKGIQIQQDALDKMKEEGKITAETVAFKQRLIDINKKRAQGLTDELTAQVKLNAIQELNNRITEGGTDIQKIAADIQAEVNAKYGEGVVSLGNLVDASKKTNEELAKGQTAATTSKSAFEGLKSVFDTVTGAFSSLFNGASAFVGKLLEFGANVTALVASFTPFANIMNQLVANFGNLATSVAPVNSGFTGINTIISPLADGFSKLVPSFDALSISSTTLGTGLPPISTSFAAIAASAPPIAETLPVIAKAMGDLGAQADPVIRVKDAFTELVTQITNSVGTIDQAVSGVDKLTASLSKLGTEGFDAASGKAGDFIRRLDDVISKSGEVIRAMQAIESAAKEALSAANSASSAGNKQRGSNRLGGYADDPAQQVSVPDSVFDNAPHFKEGTTNTSQFSSKVAGGGIPSILHPNEAVVPLARGRKIPVDLNLSGLETGGSVDLPDMSKLVAGLGAVTEALGLVASSINNIDLSTQSAPQMMSAESSAAPAPEMPRDTAAVRTPAQEIVTNRNVASEAKGSSAPSTARGKDVSVNIVVNASDADSFKRSEDQMVRSLAKKINRVTRRNG